MTWYKAENNLLIKPLNQNTNCDLFFKESFEWQKTFGGSGYEEFYSVILVQDGFIVVGESDSTDIPGITNKGEIDAIIVKYDLNGNEIWKKNFGGSWSDDFTRVIALSDGFIAVSDRIYSDDGDLTGLSTNYPLIVKYDIYGNILWKKNFFGAIENTEYIVLSNIAKTENGFVLSGLKITVIPDNPGHYEYDLDIVEYDTNGNKLYGNRYYYENTVFPFEIQTRNDGFLIVGYNEENNAIIYYIDN